MSQQFSGNDYKGRFNASNGRVTSHRKGNGKDLSDWAWVIGSHAELKRLIRLRKRLYK